jgi:hypothetical protein
MVYQPPQYFSFFLFPVVCGYVAWYSDTQTAAKKIRVVQDNIMRLSTSELFGIIKDKVYRMHLFVAGMVTFHFQNIAWN